MKGQEPLIATIIRYKSPNQEDVCLVLNFEIKGKTQIHERQRRNCNLQQKKEKENKKLYHR